MTELTWKRGTFWLLMDRSITDPSVPAWLGYIGDQLMVAVHQSFQRWHGHTVVSHPTGGSVGRFWDADLAVECAAAIVDMASYRQLRLKEGAPIVANDQGTIQNADCGTPEERAAMRALLKSFAERDKASMEEDLAEQKAARQARGPQVPA